MSLDTLTQTPLVESQRFDLRALRPSDTGLLEHYASDRRVARMTPNIPHPLPPGAMQAFVERAISPENDQSVWAIDGTRAGSAELMGIMSLIRMDKAQSELAYWVAPIFWNTGLASAAAQALVEANPLGNDTMFASVFQDNPASARVLVNCGFQYIGDAESFCIARNAKVPTWTYIHKLN